MSTPRFVLHKQRASAAPRVQPRSDVYDGAELRPPAGVDPARLRAFALPSRIGGRLYYPDGSVKEMKE